jgi:hypothetical protein
MPVIALVAAFNASEASGEGRVLSSLSESHHGQGNSIYLRPNDVAKALYPDTLREHDSLRVMHYFWCNEETL